VGGGGNCAANTEVSKQSNVGRDETMVGSSKIVVGHSSSSSSSSSSTWMLSQLLIMTIVLHEWSWIMVQKSIVVSASGVWVTMNASRFL